MNIFSIASTLENTVYELGAKLAASVEAILEAVTTRLEQLHGTRSWRTSAAATVPADDSLRNNQLHAAPMK